jgi:pentose-5-phosphate-3-epimerase
MIKIIPAILTSDLERFKFLAKKYQPASVLHIDIINSFKNSLDTITVESVLETDEIRPFTEICFHFMSDEFNVESFNQIVKYAKQNHNVDFCIALDQVMISSLPLSIKELSNIFTIPVIYNDEILSAEFYENYNDVIIMTVTAGKQGGEFKTENLKRVERLRENGFSGNIILDGGINISTIQQAIKSDIDGVVVGSYFANEKSFEELYENLEEIISISKSDFS